MASSKLKTVLKLGVLLGTPVACIAALMGAGVYMGATHRHAVTSFERDYLQLDVDVPPPESSSEPKASDPGGGTPPPAPADDPGERPPADPPPTSAQVPQPGAAQGGPAPVVLAPGQGPAPGQDPAAVPVAPATPAAQPAGTPPPAASPLHGELAQRLQLPVTAHLKVLVDPELIAEDAAWIDYIQRTVSRASQIYREQFGITLELVAIGRWQVATAGMDSVALIADLKARPREGADVLVGVTNRPLDAGVSGRSENPTGDSPFNGAYAVVYATPSHPEPHLRTLLHELGHIFGARDITDPRDPGWQAGSWMSYAAVRPGQSPWIDAGNRERILQRKDKPFAPESVVHESPAPAGAGGG
jgi:hypothetical protein